MVLHTEETTFEEFRTAWVEEIDAMESSVDKGREFAIRLASQWLDVDEDSDEFHYTDGSGDGGVDVAYLHVGANEFDDELGDERDAQGDTWYVFQCKYGTAGTVHGMVRVELRKMFGTITGERDVSRWSGSTVEKIRNFVGHRGTSKDRLVLVIGTVDPLGHGELAQLDAVRREFAESLNSTGPSLDVEAVSLKTVHDEIQKRSSKNVRVNLRGNFSPLNSGGAWIGRVSIKAMYDMLVEYRTETGELDRIYDKNVRRWLGMGKHRKVGFGIAETIRKEPENLGVYNNGVTFVCSSFDDREDRRGRGRETLVDPYIVNGCQTTRTLFEVVDRVEGAGGTGKSISPGRSYSDCYLVVKVVETNDPDHLTDITRYTNTQNAVRDSDLVSVDKDYNRWKQELELQHGMYLEIQRGGWESRRAYEKARPGLQPRLTGGGAVPVKANDIIKVFGAGWLGYPGTACRRSADFIPGPVGDNSVFGRIRQLAEDGDFGADDFRAGQAVFLAGKRLGFGARGAGLARAKTRYMFYYVFIELIRAISSSGSDPSCLPTKDVTSYVLALEQHPDDFNELATIAADAVTDYAEGTTGIPPHTLDKAYKDIGDWDSIVGSNRVDLENIRDEVPGFLEAIQQTIKVMRMPRGGPPIINRYLELLAVVQA